MLPVKRTSIIYALAAVACSMFTLTLKMDFGRWSESFILWLCVAAIPLLFVFAYPRFLFADSRSPNRLKHAAFFQALAASMATVAFVLLSPLWKNLARDPGDSILFMLLFFLVPLAVLLVFLVSAVALLLRNQSSLAIFAGIAMWPYWIVLALSFQRQWVDDTGIYALYYVLCFVAPLLLAFAAGAVFFRPRFAHAAALVGLLTLPFLYYNLRDTGLGNVWIVFNQPNEKHSVYPSYALPGICSVPLIALATATAVLRLLPARWQFRKVAISQRTWPAAAFSFAVLATWFGQSVMPYRIPGAVDYFGWPILQILHVEKRGLQFHETLASISGRRWQRNFDPRKAFFSGNDRRWLEYRFAERRSSGDLSGPLLERIRALLSAAVQVKDNSDIVRPIRDWNADRWYVNPDGGSPKIYSTANGSPPPREILDLFNDLEKLPQSNQSQTEYRDVCLGFGYDPLSEMGYLYANHRCFNAGHGVVCR